MQLVHAQDVLAQACVVVERAEVPVHRVHEVVVDGGGNLVGIEAVLEGVLVAAGVRKELELLDLGGEKPGAGVAVCAIALVDRVEGGLAQHAVVAALEADEAAVAHGVLLAL